MAITPSRDVEWAGSNLPDEAERLASLLEVPDTRETDLLSFLANVTPTVFPESDPAKRPRLVHGPQEFGVDLTFPLAATPAIGVVEIKTHRAKGIRNLQFAGQQLEHLARATPFKDSVAVAYLVSGRGVVTDEARQMLRRLSLPFPVTLLSWDDIFLRLVGKAHGEREEEKPAFTVVLVEVVNLSRRLLRALANEPGLLAGIDDRKFEELVATLLFDLGLQDVELTPPRQDGGRDIVAVHENHRTGERQVFLIECKHWVSGTKVTMRWALSLLDIKNREEATGAVLLSSSGFGPRLVEQEAVLKNSGLFLKNASDLTSWIKVWERQYGAILLEPVHPAEALGLEPGGSIV